MGKTKIGVLVMSYGTPESLDQIEAYYTHIRRGSPPSEQQLNELKQRYEAIVGGFFPLRENTNRQVHALEKELNDHASEDVEYVCYQGLKHAAPFIEDGVRQMVADGIQKAVGIVLAPHYSIMSVGGYMKRAQEEAAQAGLEIRFVKSYHMHPQLLEALNIRVQKALRLFGDVEKDQVKVLFSAHSLPEKILEMKDPYPQQLNETAAAVAELAGVTNWQFAWQSAGKTAMPWLGPDILDVIRTLRNDEQVHNVLVCPVGFVSDHLEVLYDLDIEAKQLAHELDMHLERTESLNTDPRYVTTLREAIVTELKKE